MTKTKYLDMEFIGFIMEQNGLTVRDLSQCTKYSVATIRKYLNGADQKRMSSEMVLRFAKSLNVLIVQLLFSKYV